MPSALTQVGAYPLTSTGKLPNVDVASPGEVWSNKRAHGIIVPGTLVKPVLIGGIGMVAAVATADTIEVATANVLADETHVYQPSLAIAMRQIMVPDINPGSQYNLALGPNEIVNLPIADKDYVRTYHTGAVHITLCMPYNGYKEGDLLGWAPLADRPAGKTEGHGAWSKVGVEPNNKAEEPVKVVAGSGILIVSRAAPVLRDGNEAVLTCRFLRSNQ